MLKITAIFISTVILFTVYSLGFAQQPGAAQMQMQQNMQQMQQNKQNLQELRQMRQNQLMKQNQPSTQQTGTQAKQPQSP